MNENHAPMVLSDDAPVAGRFVLFIVRMGVAREKRVNQANEHILNRVNNLDFQILQQQGATLCSGEMPCGHFIVP